MVPRLVVMLTHNDKTVKDALALFHECKDLPVQYWGFKNVGLSDEEMKELVKAFRDAGKSTVLEVVAHEEKECLQAAQFGIECGFDYLTGTVYHPSVLRLVRESPLKYMPFIGKRPYIPSVMVGSLTEIVAEARELEGHGVDGITLISFRHKQEEPVNLTREVMRSIDIPIIMAGSINSYSRLDLMKELNPWGFTIGGAFFDKKFVPGGSFREQIEDVLAYMLKPVQ
jgi:hypothetical protein